jgi:hypothetical protein
MHSLFSTAQQILTEFWDHSSGEFLSALAGASMGAGAAYYLQNKSEKRKDLEAKQGAIVRAQLSLITMLNTLHNIRIQFLEKHRNAPDRTSKMAAFSQNTSQQKIDYDSLAFLLLTDYANTVQIAYLAEASYNTSIAALDDRNRAYYELFEKGKIVRMEETGESTVHSEVKHIRMLHVTTDNLFTSVDNSILRCTQAIQELLYAGKATFPGLKFLLVPEIQIPNTPNGATQEKNTMNNDTAHRWSQHYDSLQWTVNGILLGAAGAMYVFTLEKNFSRVAVAAAFLMLLSIFFTYSFRALRSAVHKSFSDQEWDAARNIIRNNSVFKQGTLNILTQTVFFEVLVYRVYEMRPELKLYTVFGGICGLLLILYWGNEARKVERN